MQCLQYQIKLLFLSRSGSSSFGDRECSQVTTALFGRPVAFEDRVESTDNIDSDIVHRLYRGEKWWFWRGLEGSPLSGAYLSISIDFKRYRLSLSFIVGHTARHILLTQIFVALVQFSRYVVFPTRRESTGCKSQSRVGTFLRVLKATGSFARLLLLLVPDLFQP